MKFTNQRLLRKNVKVMKKRGHDLRKLTEVAQMLSNEKKLPAKYKDHALKGSHKGLRECHIQPDWLLMYRINENQLVLVLSRTGTHSDLF
jgi:mRNA interferase YafQ